jgi:hypothetical protein
MKTQISRFSHQPEKRYSGVYQQQGRMLTDADWNELMEIVKERLEDVLRDVIGSGVPSEGGLGVIKDEKDKWKIKPGCVYVDGIRGEICAAEGEQFIDFDKQVDFPNVTPNAAEPSDDCIFYADLWERPVISLEDPDLVDPGLYGADTCFRTQTMVQIKWCDASKDPEDPKKNPNRGDAEFDLHPLETSTDKTVPSIHPGNFLFRLEVHDVRISSNNSTEITLKWSCENGAEQYPWNTKPDDFGKGKWIYEFYNDTSEKHLGVHLASGFSPLRWRLSDKLEKPDSINTKLGDSTKVEEPAYVRRWDGYCILKQNDQSWKINESYPNQNSVNLKDGNDGMILTVVIMDILEMELQLKNKRFIAGDYWLAVVRDNTPIDQHVSIVSECPFGIKHHYLKLGEIKDNNWIPGENPFPTLTNLPVSSNNTVGENGQYKTITDALQKLTEEINLSLLLLPGEHKLEDAFKLNNKSSIKIEGAGTKASIIELGEMQHRLEGEEIIFRDLCFKLKGNKDSVILQGKRVSTENCSFEREPTSRGENIWFDVFTVESVNVSNDLHNLTIAVDDNVVWLAGVVSGTGKVRFGDKVVTPSPGYSDVLFLTCVFHAMTAGDFRSRRRTVSGQGGG